MKVALYEEGKFWEQPTTIRVFASLEVAKQAIPKGFEDKTAEYGYCDLYAEDEHLPWYATIRMYEVEETV